MSDADRLLIRSAFRQIETHLRNQVDCPQLRTWRASVAKYERVVESWTSTAPTAAQSDAVLESVMDLLVEVGKGPSNPTAPPPPAIPTAAPPGFAQSEMPASVARGAELQARMKEALPAGARIEVGEPICVQLVGGQAMWVCVAKVKKQSEPGATGPPAALDPSQAAWPDDREIAPEVTETMFLVTGTGKSEAEALRDAEEKVVQYSAPRK